MYTSIPSHFVNDHDDPEHIPSSFRQSLSPTSLDIDADNDNTVDSQGFYYDHPQATTSNILTICLTGPSRVSLSLPKCGKKFSSIFLPLIIVIAIFICIATVFIYIGFSPGSFIDSSTFSATKASILPSISSNTIPSSTVYVHSSPEDETNDKDSQQLQNSHIVKDGKLIITLPSSDHHLTRVVEYHFSANPDTKRPTQNPSQTTTSPQPQPQPQPQNPSGDASKSSTPPEDIPLSNAITSPSSPSASSSSSSSPSLLLTHQTRMLIVSRHHGTTTDLKTVGEAFHFDVTHISFHPWIVFMKSPDKEHEHFYQSHIIEAMCKDYDIIAVSDVIWDGWMFLQPQFAACHAKVVLVASNRFDTLLGTDERTHWYNTLNNALALNNNKYPHIIENNPFEAFHMRRMGITLEPPVKPEVFNKNPLFVPQVPTIRPLGMSVVPLDTSLPLSETPPKCLYYHHDPAAMTAYRYAKRHGFKHTCQLFKMPYGGPTWIRQQNAPFLFFPYQVSVMKMWENVKAGSIITLIPSATLIRVILPLHHEFRHVRDGIAEIKQVMGNDRPETWTPFVDFYSELYSPCVVKFNSWEELDTIVRDETWRQQQPICEKYAAMHSDGQLLKWHAFFKERFPHVTLPPYTEHQIYTAKTLYNLDISN